MAVGTAFPRAGRTGGRRSDLNLSGRSRVRPLPARVATDSPAPPGLTTADAQTVIADLLDVLERAGLLTIAVDAQGRRRPATG